MAPVPKKLSAAPAGKPSMKTDIAQERLEAGYRSPISDDATGAQTASPIPIPKRVANRDQKPAAAPERAVSTLQKNSPAVNNAFLLNRSARRPNGTPTAA